MDTLAIANTLCDEADDLLAGVSKRTEARAAIAEALTIRHSKLPPAAKKAVIDQVMNILDREGFFEGEAGDSGDEPGDFTAAEEV
ncbi:MAG: hypothetical protein ACHQ5A_00675 [Opitutales bacterium]